MGVLYRFEIRRYLVNKERPEMDQANYPWHPSILHSNKRLSSLPGIRTHRPCGRNMLRPGSFTRRGPAQRTRPPWKISRPDVEVAWWPLGRCCIHLACIAAHLFDQTSFPCDGLLRINELRMGISAAAPITRGEAPRESSRWMVELRPASRGLSVGPAIGDDIHAGCERTECLVQALGVCGHRGSHFSLPLLCFVCW